jgi:hypothetical protein
VESSCEFGTEPSGSKDAGKLSSVQTTRKLHGQHFVPCLEARFPVSSCVHLLVIGVGECLNRESAIVF